jgi:putative restriction endonuclease
MDEDEIRVNLFNWLKQRSSENGGVFDRSELIYDFKVRGQVITLLGPAGIWFPKGFEIPISIATTSNGPYDDGFTEEGFLNYRYRGNDPYQRDNIGLRNAFQRRKPLVYFHSIKPSKYVAVWPVFVLQDDPSSLCVKVAIDPAYGDLSVAKKYSILPSEGTFESDIGIRKYITTVTKQRLHQSAFREFVLDAYHRQCSMCRLQHTELLDAAHIIPDSEEDGLPIVQNGLSLCKIHHAAYDRNIIGITPDFEIKLRPDILHEIDGPMLKYGLQSLEGSKLELPKKKSEYPDQNRLEIRYNLFLP